MVFIHREAVPFGPPVIEWVIARIWKKKIVYDFDDAIWLTDRTNEPWIVKRVKWRSKVGVICKLSHKISCGNPYLAEFAKSFNANVYVIPTTIDIENAHNPRKRSVRSDAGTTIGWTGSHSTLKYLSTVVPVLQALEEKYLQIDFLIIADKNPGLPLKRMTFKPWRKETEIEDLAEIDIGIMPLPDDPWTRGKCGFKALQYMAMGIPAVLSPVGINRDIVEDGQEGYWCTTPEDWSTRLEELIENNEQRKRMGIMGRKKIAAHYSVASNLARFLSLFQ
ncbi:MAG: glycosyltransferase [Chryseosolibacter sp.]